MIAVVCLVLGAALFVIGRQFLADDSEVNRPRDAAWFTTDDGATWFADEVTKLAPFDHNGSPAYRCYVYSCDGKKFVSHLERFSPEAKRRMEELRKKPDAPPVAMNSILTTGLEVKQPGAGHNWIPQSDPKAAAITQPHCPDAAGKAPVPVLP